MIKCKCFCKKNFSHQSGLPIRLFQEAEAHSISCIYIRTWQDTYLGLVPFGYLHSMALDRLEQDFINELKRKISSVMLPKMQVRWWDLLAAVMNDMVMISTMVKFAHRVC